MNEQTVVLATGNPGKLHELQHMLADSGINVTPQSEYNVPEAVEDGLSFVENAIIKARNASKYTGLPAIADDSGIEVDALHGEPGIHSARFAGDNASDEDNWKLLLSKLKGLPNKKRKARFRCLMVYVRHADDPTPIICQGSWEGRILESPQGKNGFGYDPVFLVPDKNCSAAELSPETKNVLSHRGKALVCITAKLKAMQTLSD
jgi:XTP/dITP diphosphohydrolase